MSHSTMPTLPWVLPMYEHMLRSLTAQSSDQTFPANLRIAASAGLGKLQKYYVPATDNQFNVIATGTVKSFTGLS